MMARARARCDRPSLAGLLPSHAAGLRAECVRSSGLVHSSSCPSRSASWETWTWPGMGGPFSEHPARRRATSVQPVHSRVRQDAGASPRIGDHGAIVPNPRWSSMCQQSLACLPCRRPGGAGLRPNLVASSRPTNADAWRPPSLVRFLVSGARVSRSFSSETSCPASGALPIGARRRQSTYWRHGPSRPVPHEPPGCLTYQARGAPLARRTHGRR
jgi:hypothetical protein